MKIEKLNKILNAHGKWLHNEEGGERAVLLNEDLRNSDLRGSNLSCSDLSGSDLSGSNLSGSNLSCSNLRCSNLSGSNLSCSNLSGSDLSGSNLRYSDLSGAKTDKRYIIISCIGSRKGSTTYCFDDDKIWCGCWKGSLDEFEQRVRKEHAEHPQYLAEYLGAIGYIRSLIAVPESSA